MMYQAPAGGLEKLHWFGLPLVDAQKSGVDDAGRLPNRTYRLASPVPPAIPTVS